MDRSFLLPLALLAAVLAPSLTAPGAVVGLNPTADAFVTTGPSNNLSGNNYGGGGALGLSAAGLSNGEFQALLSFDTSAARSAFDAQYGAGAWTVQSVTLQLTATTVNNPIFNANTAGSFSLTWTLNDAWTEGTGSPNAPGTTGLTYTSLQSLINPGADEVLGTFAYDASSTGNVVYTLSTPAGFMADLLAGSTVSLRSAAADAGVSYLFNSRSASTVANRPVLSITAVPEPFVPGLLLLGGLLGARRRRTIHPTDSAP